MFCYVNTLKDKSRRLFYFIGDDRLQQFRKIEKMFGISLFGRWSIQLMKISKGKKLWRSLIMTLLKMKFPVDENMSVGRFKKAVNAYDFKEVMVIGYGEGGELVVRSSKMCRKDALWLLEEAKLYTIGVKK